jgi:hypothetical protein
MPPGPIAAASQESITATGTTTTRSETTNQDDAADDDNDEDEPTVPDEAAPAQNGPTLDEAVKEAVKERRREARRRRRYLIFKYIYSYSYHKFNINYSDVPFNSECSGSWHSNGCAIADDVVLMFSGPSSWLHSNQDQQNEISRCEEDSNRQRTTIR